MRPSKTPPKNSVIAAFRAALPSLLDQLHIAFIRRRPVATAPLSDSRPANPAMSLPHCELHHLHHSHPLGTAFIQGKPVSTALFGDSCLPTHLPNTASLPRFELHHLHHSHPLHTAFIQGKPVSTALFGDSCLPTHLPNTASLPRFELHHLHHSHPLHTAFIQGKPVSTALFINLNYKSQPRMHRTASSKQTQTLKTRHLTPKTLNPKNPKP